MQTHKSFSARLTDEDRQTIATWRKRVLAFYGVLSIAAALFVFGVGLDKPITDDRSQFSGMTASSKE